MACLLFCPGLSAQTEVPTFHAGTKLVEVVVIVKSKDKPAAGLTKDDFTVLDNGKPQKIAFFSVRSAVAPGTNAASLPPGAVSNRPERAGETATQATVILLDQKNTSQENQAFAIQRIAKFVDSRRGQDRIGIYVFGREHILRAVQEVTGEADLLGRAAHSMKAQDPNYRTSDTTGMTQHAADGYNAIDLIERASDTRNVLRGISRHLAGVPGRKRVIWITTAFPLMVPDLGLDFRPDMEKASRALNDANIALYAVDARGLIGALSGMTGISNAETAGPPANLPLGRSMRGAAPPQGLATMQMVADLTGGLVYFNKSNAIDESIQSALDDSGYAYTLGFYPAQGEQDGASHKLKVAVARRGVSLRYRDNYFAPKAVAPDESRKRQQLLTDSLDATQIRVVVELRPDPANAGLWHIKVNVDPRDLDLDHVNASRSGAIDISFLLAPSGKIVTKTLKIDLPDNQLAAFLESGIETEESIVTAGLPETLRVLVQDRATGAAGSVTIPLGGR